MRKVKLCQPVNCDRRELSIYLRALEEGFWPEPSSVGELSARSKLIRIARRSCAEGNGKGFFLGSRCTLMSVPLMETSGEEKQTSLQVGSPVNRSAWPEKGKESKTRGTCGRIQSGSFGKWDQASRSWKTYQGFFPTTISASSSETWQKRGTMRNGMLFQPLPSEPRICGKDCGFLPTPRAMDGMPQSQNATTARLSGEKSGDVMLSSLIHWWEVNKMPLLPTPNAYEDRAEKYTLETSKKHLSEGRQIHLSQAVRLRQGGGKLNPEWVEWLMGWPIGWTAYEQLATDKFLVWQRSHLQFLQDVRDCPWGTELKFLAKQLRKRNTFAKEFMAIADLKKSKAPKQEGLF